MASAVACARWARHRRAARACCKCPALARALTGHLGVVTRAADKARAPAGASDSACLADEARRREIIGAAARGVCRECRGRRASHGSALLPRFWRDVGLGVARQCRTLGHGGRAAPNVCHALAGRDGAGRGSACAQSHGPHGLPAAGPGEASLSCAARQVATPRPIDYPTRPGCPFPAPVPTCCLQYLGGAEVRPGDFVEVVGEYGTGKSTVRERHCHASQRSQSAQGCCSPLADAFRCSATTCVGLGPISWCACPFPSASAAAAAAMCR